MQLPSLSHNLPRLGCFCGTFRPAWRQIRSTRLWFTSHPSCLSIAVIHLQPAVFLSPAVVGLIRDPDGLAHRRDRLTLGQFNIRLPKLVDDLLSGVTASFAHDLGLHDPP